MNELRRVANMRQCLILICGRGRVWAFGVVTTVTLMTMNVFSAKKLVRAKLTTNYSTNFLDSSKQPFNLFKYCQFP